MTCENLRLFLSFCLLKCIDKSFSNSLSLVARGQAHSVMKNVCLRNITTDFVNKGSIEDLDTTCVENIRPAPFFTSLLGPDP